MFKKIIIIAIFLLIPSLANAICSGVTSWVLQSEQNGTSQCNPYVPEGDNNSCDGWETCNSPTSKYVYEMTNCTEVGNGYLNCDQSIKLYVEGQDCSQERAALVAQCGSESNIATWDEATCSGTCSCDYTEYLKQRNNCPSGANFIWDEETCTGTCEGLGSCSDEQMQAAVAACDPKGIKWIDTTDPACPYECNQDCSEKKLEAQIVCGSAGVAGFNWETCEYSCDKCPKELDKCEQGCSDKGGVYHFDCSTSSSGLVASTCVCNDDPELPDPPEEPEDPDDPLDPPDDPDDPTEPPIEPGDGEDEKTNKWLKEIKDNTDDIIKETNDSNKYLSNIDKNQAKEVNNQGIINNSIKSLGSHLQKSNSKLDNISAQLGDIRDGVEDGMNTEGIENAIGDLGNDLEDAIAEANNEEKYDGATPDEPDFDTTLPDDYDYTQKQDATAEANASAQTDAQSLIDELDNSSTPYNSQLTAVGDACINGTVMNTPISICFDKPWMKQGYAIMKIIFIAMGYLQTAMLLNRGLGA